MATSPNVTVTDRSNPEPATPKATEKVEASVPKITYELLKQPNELRQYSSFNYIFTLACLTPSEINNPDLTYRKNPPAVQVLRSGGGAQGKALTAYETSSKQLEYFIDDVEIESIIVPTNATRVSNATSINFKVYEPYSMGLFLQSLQVAAKAALGSTASYNRACFALIVEFIGYDDNGDIVASNRTRRVYPFKIVTAEFEVTDGGSVYSVTGVPWNEQAQSSTVQTVAVDTQIIGRNVVEMLQKGVQSLTTVLNKRILEKQQANTVTSPDEYIIIFPKDISQPINPDLNAAPGSEESATKTTDKEFYQSITGLSADERVKALENRASSVRDKYVKVESSNNNISANIKKLVDTEDTINDLGKAKFADSLRDGGEVPFGVEKFSYSEQKGIFEQEDIRASQNYRAFTFPQGTTIEKIIEEIIITSSYGQEAATTKIDDKTGNIPWFRIQTQTYIVPNEETLQRTGEHPKIYVYMVVPYNVHSSVFKGVNTASTGVKDRKIQASKEYSYIYTGKNEDILDFKIELNNAFYSAIAAGGSDGSADVKTGTKDSTSSKKTENYKVNEGQAGVSSSSGGRKAADDHKVPTGNEGGGGNDNVAISVARQFNEAIINSKADLLTMELSILGDPYYIADTGVGNYNAPPGSGPGITADGTMNYQSNEVDVVVNFRTPIDYREDGTLEFPQDTVPVKAFSGLYRVLIVRNSFAGGKFQQVLELVRRPNQEEDIGVPGTPGPEGKLMTPAKPEESDQDSKESSYRGDA
jgi:hypothetical protein